MVTQKIRQGRKAVTLLTGFELFGLDAEELAEELRKLCSSSTTGRLTPHEKYARIDTFVNQLRLSRESHPAWK